MSSLNKVSLIGNLGKDPEVRTLDNGNKVASFSIATTESWKDKNGERQSQTEWHNVVLWKGLAGVAESYLKKGSKVYVEGKLTTRSYEKDGQTRYITEIVGRDLIMLDSKGQSQQAVPNEQTPQPVENQTAGQEGDDLPF